MFRLLCEELIGCKCFNAVLFSPPPLTERRNMRHQPRPPRQLVTETPGRARKKCIHLPGTRKRLFVVYFVPLWSLMISDKLARCLLPSRACLTSLLVNFKRNYSSLAIILYWSTVFINHTVSLAYLFLPLPCSLAIPGKPSMGENVAWPMAYTSFTPGLYSRSTE